MVKYYIVLLILEVVESVKPVRKVSEVILRRKDKQYW